MSLHRPNAGGFCAMLLTAALQAQGQITTPSPVTSHTGCVTATPDDTTSLVLSAPSGCSLLSGKLAKARLAGHVVVLKGTLLDATPTTPQTLLIDNVQSVGAACQETCTLEPPGHRGLHSKPKNGTQAGTPGN